MKMRRTPTKPSNAVVEAILLIPVAILLIVIAIRVDALDRLYAYSRAHEGWELDEIVLTVLIVGFFGFIYAIRRVLDLNREAARRASAEHESAWLGRHDLLTRLPNRHSLPDLFTESLEAEKRGHKWSRIVVSVDLADFRKTNDLLGQSGGDQLLVVASDRLLHIAGDELVLRLGADDFLIIADRKRIADPFHFSSRLMNALREPATINGTRVEVSANLGYALYPRDAPTLEGTVRRAEFAMNQARKQHRAIVAFDRGMEDMLNRRAELERDLTRAVHNDEIEPHYQPIIDLKTGRVHGFEALARWNREGDGLVPPSIFIDLAEKKGLIVELSEKLLKKACRDARAWPEQTSLSFNISPWQLADRLLGLRILKILSDAGLPAERLVIEVTESALIRDPDTAEAVLNELHNAGVKLALDDFGTGYSSLFQLSRFPFDVIKIDQSFVEAFENDEKQARIIRAVIMLANGLGIDTTAEGIERMSQSIQLKDLGCVFGQGFLFGKALPANQLGAFLEPIKTEVAKPASRRRFTA